MILRLIIMWILLVLGAGLAHGGGGGGRKWLCSRTTFCTHEHEKVAGETYIMERFESQRDCRLSCGRYGAVWPMPTGPTISLSHSRVHFDPQQIGFNVSAPSEATRLFLHETRRLFVGNLRKECPRNCTVASGARIVIEATVNSESLVLDWRTHENYKLAISSTETGTLVAIQATTVYGARHALETVSNLVTGSVTSGLLLVSDVIISDRPYYAHRGLLLDTSRNFIPLRYVRRAIDGMAASKMNVLHWHVVDAESFPLEITRVPQLQLYGAYSSSHTYSRKQVLQLMQYARLRGIRIIIEIAGPAHANSGWQWGPDEGLDSLAVCLESSPWAPHCAASPCGQLNPVNDNMYAVLKAIFRQVAEMGAPEETIHMGGHGVHTSCWNGTEQIRQKMLSQGYDLSEESFRRLWAQFHQRNLLAWDEINRHAYPSLPEPKPVILWSSRLTDPDSIESYLSQERFIIQTLVNSHDSLNRLLLDRGYRLIVSTRNAWCLSNGFDGFGSEYHSWRRVYENEMPQCSDRRQVLGGEVCLWSESVDQNSLESRLWPRAGAAAERFWSNPKAMRAYMIERRFYRYRDRLLDRGIQAEAVTPRYCVLHEGMCEQYYYGD